MEPFHASLADEDGQTITEVEGTIESSEEAAGVRSGRFELQDTESFMQGVLEGKTFRLQLDGGNPFTIKVESVSIGSRSGFSEAQFSTV
ncbi:hypothetical protein [Singulisphaera acidiphila]|uniref:Uncharacterized protein n=1 Tax=Singulisphaera acidiphila (strain ATCC BAA-1392 / DSM 18658 / VKM B-2454 / MOB10) TaxID=886293 RepID=L0D500_SINAD|nr:hypothetical protein [Singulisphaera acidiphila]AGA24509.1 hypothetical protein Sinac_0047 [Singulisphaera acidiphila DSM 18658]